MRRSNLFYVTICGACTLVLGFAMLMFFETHASPPIENRLPQRLAVISISALEKRPASMGEIAVAPNGYVYIVDYSGAVEVFSGLERIASIPWPDHNGVERLSARIVAHPDNGYLYLSDGGRDTIHVIRDTQLITSLHIGGWEAHYLAIDEQSGYVYAIGRKQSILPDMIPINTMGIIDGAQLISQTEWQKVDTGSIAYNPISGHIYLGQFHDPQPYKQSLGMVLQLEAGKPVTTTALPDDEYGGIHKIVVNRETGEMYMLRDKNDVLYWDGEAYKSFRVPPPPNDKSYVLEDIAIDTTSGLAYVTSSDVAPSHVFVLRKDEVIAELPIQAYFNRGVAVDEKHNYVYVTNYRSAGLTVIRGTEVITTMSTGGVGPWDVAVDEQTDLIYVTNADAGSVAIFGFDEADKPTFWQRFFPFIQR